MKVEVALLLVTMALCSCRQNSEEDQWVNLFDGQNIESWTVLTGGSEYLGESAVNTAEFLVEEGCITGISTLNAPNTFLATPEEYKNFILEFEMKMDEGLNSGVQIRSHSMPEYRNGSVHGLQVECDDSPRAWSGGIYDEARNGWRYPLEYNKAAKSAFRKGEWNRYRVLAYEHHIITWVNDIACANLVEENAETGFIALQVHMIFDSTLAGKKIQWKNIRIKPSVEADLETLGKVDAPEVSYLKNELTENEKKQGWKLLWDGQTTEGWRGARMEGFPPEGWGIKDGELTVVESGGAESSAGGDIVTTSHYRNFILEADFRLTPGANSGIKYFVDPELNQGEGSAIGCEFQILDDVNHPDAKLGVKGNRTLGSLYDLIPANAQMYNPYIQGKGFNNIGPWNRARIVADGKHVEHYLNGIKIVEYDRSTQEWRALVAYSKYADWPDFGELEEGNILLQEHGNEVAFKNIKILELP